MPAGRRRLIAVLLGAALLIALVPPLVTVNRLKRRLETAASEELGRKVHLGDVSVRLLPYPGFDINGVEIADDPAFSAEPMLTAESVTVRLRPSSLWSGRIEFSRFSFDYPSLNLVRDESGRWNVESLLQHTASAAAAPTGSPRAAAPRFPYIEVTNGRINFKHGVEKQAFTLLDSDLALWLDSETKWRVRLETRPTRTDQYLSDTGTLRAEGSFARAPAQALGQVPFQLEADMERGQLGQLTSLLTGEDRGWRGDLRLTLALDGKLDELAIKADARVSGMRRYDIPTGPGFRADLSCASNLVRTGPLVRELRNLECDLPAANGGLALSGRLSLPFANEYDLKLKATDFPVATAAEWYRHAKRSVAPDLIGEGLINGDWRFDSAGPSGSGKVTDLALMSDREKGVIHISSVALAFPEKKRPAAGRPGGDEMRLGPVPVDFGGGKPVALVGGLLPSGLHLGIRGPADASRLQASAAMLGLAAARLNADGMLDLDLGVDVAWKEFAPAVVTGKVHWKDLTIQVPDSEASVHSSSGLLTLSPAAYVVKPFAAEIGKAANRIEGEITLPRSCDAPPCEARFAIKTDALDVPALAAVLSPKERPSGWFTFSGPVLGSQAPRAWLVDRRASGTIAVQKLAVASLTAAKMSGNIRLAERKLVISGIRGSLLGGRYTGAWTVDLSADSPEVTGESHGEDLSAAQLLPWLKSNHAAGTLTGDLRLKMSGPNKAALVRTAEGVLGFVWKNGSLSRVEVDGAPLRFTSLMGKVNVRNGAGSIEDAELRTSRSTYKVNGALTFDGTLDLRFSSPLSEITVRGSLETPVVEESGRSPKVARESAPGKSSPPQ